MQTNKPVIFVTGQNGLVGSHLKTSLADTYEIVGLERTNSSNNNPSWNYRQTLKKLAISAPDAVIHLAGAGIADKRWTQAYKQTIYESRINGTQWLADEILIHEVKPKAFLCASAIGYYGHRPGELLDESSSVGENFVAKIASQWEAATERLSRADVRVVNMRFGMILSPKSGALKEMLLPFKLGLGGRMGNGQQTYTWVALEDVNEAIRFLLNNSKIKGPINITAPNPVSNQVFAQSLAKALNRPAFIPMPKTLVRLIFGEVADELLLADAQVQPTRLLAAGFKFTQPDLSLYLNEALT